MVKFILLVTHYPLSVRYTCMNKVTSSFYIVTHVPHRPAQPKAAGMVDNAKTASTVFDKRSRKMQSGQPWRARLRNNNTRLQSSHTRVYPLHTSSLLHQATSRPGL